MILKRRIGISAARALFGAVGWLAASFSASAAEILDILIGHEDGRSRIEFALTDAADIRQVAPRRFRLTGVSTTAILLDFGNLHAPLSGLVVAPDGPDATRLDLQISTEATAQVFAGESSSGFRLVVDLSYAADPRYAVARDTARRQFAAAGWPASATLANSASADAAERQTLASASSTPVAPAGQSSATAQNDRAAGGAPGPARLAAAEPAAADVAAPIDTLRQPPRAAPISREAFLQKAEAMLGADLGAAGCDSARADLRQNAWDIAALVGYGLCLAADDRPNEADRVFRRLLSIEPSSFEANVGRALVAQLRGARDDAETAYRAALAAEDASPDAVAEIQTALAQIEDAS